MNKTSLTDSHSDSHTPQIGEGATRDNPSIALRVALPGSDREAAKPLKDETTQKTAALSAAVLPLLGSNQDSPDPESGVLPVTPRGSFNFFPMELRGIEPLTSAVRLQRSPS